MSSKAKKILALVLIALVMGSFGFFLGKKLKYKIKEHSKTVTLKQEEEGQASLKDLKVYGSEYELIHPDVGPIIQTADILVTYEGNEATFIPAANLLPRLKVNQNVILFDQEGYVLPLGGKISAISDQEVIVSLPEGTNTEFLNTELSIILEQANNVKRLPKSLINTDEVQKTYVWIASRDNTENDDTVYRGRRQYIDISNSFIGDDFVAINHKISIKELIVFNPDNKMRSDRLYNMTPIVLERPIHNPIRQAWLDYDAYRLRKQDDELQKITEDCYNGGPSVQGQTMAGGASYADGSAGGGCGGGINYSQDPMDIFNDLISRLPVDDHTHEDGDHTHEGDYSHAESGHTH